MRGGAPRGSARRARPRPRACPASRNRSTESRGSRPLSLRAAGACGRRGGGGGGGGGQGHRVQRRENGPGIVGDEDVPVPVSALPHLLGPVLREPDPVPPAASLEDRTIPLHGHG